MKKKGKELQSYKLATLVQVSTKKLRLEELNYPLLISYIKTHIVDKKIQKGKIFTVSLFGDCHDFQIDRIQPNFEQGQAVRATEQTEVHVVEWHQEMESNKRTEHMADHLYGMEKQQAELEQSIMKSINSEGKLQNFGLSRIKGILVLAINGMGKTSLVKTVKNRLTGINFKTYQSFNLLSKVIGGSQQLVKQIFKEAARQQPSVLVFQDLHLLFGKGKNQNQTILSALLVELENLKESDRVVVVGTSNLDRQLDSNIKRSGRFEKEILLELPSHEQRKKILTGFLQKVPNSLTETDIHEINLRLNGFSNGQIKQIIRQAYLFAQQSISKQTLQKTLKNFRPSGIKELLTEVPQVHWSQIGGYKKVKDKIRQVIEWPLLHPQSFRRMGIQPLKGILLYGPPGCSKTMMAKAIATESKLNFLAVKGPELFNKYVGQSERAVRNIFKRARTCSPCVIFFDQIDALATQRTINSDVSDRVLCQLLNQMDGIEGLKDVTIVAATNRPQILDPALLRPGRFDHLVYIPPPDQEARKEIFKINLKGTIKCHIGMPLSETIEEVSEKLSKETQNYSGAQICLICREGGLLALTEDMESAKVTLNHFLQAKKKIKGRLTKQMINEYESYAENLKFF